MHNLTRLSTEWWNISIKTVEFNKAAIMQGLDLYTFLDLTRHALEHGIVGRDDLS